jgi:hypothetical protein
MAVFPALLVLTLVLAAGAQGTTIGANNAAFVTPLGRTYLPSGGDGVGLSWLGGGVRVSHTGRVLRATFGPTGRPFKVTFSQAVKSYMPWQGVSLVPASGQNESVVVAYSAGVVDVLLNLTPQYFEGGAGGVATLLSLTTDGTFQPAPAAPSRVVHVLGDSITAATNIHGGFLGCADEGYQDDLSASWSGILCSFFGASCSSVAVGGKCLIDACAGEQIPAFYQQSRYIDSAPFPFKDPSPVAFWSFLGTNDWNGRGGPAIDALFTATYLQLFKNVTSVYYPGSSPTFFLVLGPMSPTAPAKAHVDTVAQGLAAGYKVVLINATTACGLDLSGCTDGCATHPGVSSHRNIARVAAPIIAEAMGWPMPGVL